MTAIKYKEQRLAKEIANTGYIAKLQQTAQLAEQRKDNKQQQQKKQQYKILNNNLIKLFQIQITVAAPSIKKAYSRPHKSAAAAKVAAKRL